MCSRSWSGQLESLSQTSQLCPLAPTLCAYHTRAISRHAASRRRCSACVSGASSRAPCSHMLIDEDRVSIGVHGDEAGRPRCALVRLLLQLHPLCHELALQIADVGERCELLSVAV